MSSEYEQRIAAAVRVLREECYTKGREDALAQSVVRTERLELALRSLLNRYTTLMCDENNDSWAAEAEVAEARKALDRNV